MWAFGVTQLAKNHCSKRPGCYRWDRGRESNWHCGVGAPGPTEREDVRTMLQVQVLVLPKCIEMSCFSPAMLLLDISHGSGHSILCSWLIIILSETNNDSSKTWVPCRLLQGAFEDRLSWHKVIKTSKKRRGGRSKVPVWWSNSFFEFQFEKVDAEPLVLGGDPAPSVQG